VFAYGAHTVCDRNNFVLDVKITAGSLHDSVVFDEVYQSVKQKYGKPKRAVLDAGYKTPWICKQLLDDGVEPYMPYKRPMTKKGYFKKYEYAYDEYYDCYICPENQVLEYTTTNREGYREYKSKCSDCATCPSKEKCTQSQNSTKVVTRHIWQEYLEKAEDLRHTSYGQALYATRGQTIERVFADAKEKHGMRYTRMNGLTKIKSQVLMTFACLNLKKLTKLKEKLGLLSSFIVHLFSKKNLSFSI